MLGVGGWVGPGGWRRARAQSPLPGSESGPQGPQQDTRRAQAWRWDSPAPDGTGTGLPPWPRPPAHTVVSSPNLTTPSACSSGFLVQMRAPQGWGSHSCFGCFADRQEPHLQTARGHPEPWVPPCCPSIIPHPPVTSGTGTQAPSPPPRPEKASARSSRPSSAGPVFPKPR